MNLKIFSPDTIPSKGSSETHLITVSLTPHGRILFSNAFKLIGLKAGTKVAFAQDKNDPSAWYLIVDEEGFELKESRTNVSLEFYSRPICKAFLSSVDAEGTSRFRIGHTSVLEGRKVYPVFTKENLLK